MILGMVRFQDSSKRYWLLPLFAFLSLVLSTTVWSWDTYDFEWVIRNPKDWLSFFLGMCFLGFFVWECANVLRKKSTYLLLTLSVCMLFLTVFVGLLSPNIDQFYHPLDSQIATLFILFTVTVLLFSNYLLMNTNQVDRLRIHILAAFLLITSILFLGIFFSGPMSLSLSFLTFLFFFVMVVAIVLLWEGLLDSRREQRGFFEIMAITGISLLAVYMAVWVNYV
jgi:hypothetical protein